jgi:hypothetical protein
MTMGSLGVAGDGIIVVTLLLVALTTLLLVVSSRPHDGDKLEVTQVIQEPFVSAKLAADS